MRTFWTPEQDRILRERYPHESSEAVARTLGRSLRAVYSRAIAFGLRKSEAFLASDLSGRIQRGKQDPRMKPTQFKRGQEPWNKGISFHSGGRSVETRFKPGQMSGAAARNYVPIGSLRITKDGTLERKVTDDHPVPARRWVAVARLVWEAEKGPIPTGHVVAFKPGMRTTDPAQITLDRLELISRAELAKRNHPRNTNPELGQLYQLKGAITRQVNRLAREQNK